MDVNDRKIKIQNENKSSLLVGLSNQICFTNPLSFNGNPLLKYKFERACSTPPTLHSLEPINCS